MRWVKHLCRAHKDPKVAALIEAEGYEAVGLYWRLVEEIGDALGATSVDPSATHTLIGWAQILQLNSQKLNRLLDRLHGVGLLDCARVPDELVSARPTHQKLTRNSALTRVKLTIPKLLKYRDEYQKKSGQTPESLRTNSVSKIQITDTELEQYSLSEDFSEQEKFSNGGNIPPQSPPLRSGGESSAPFRGSCKPGAAVELAEPVTAAEENWAKLQYAAERAGMLVATGQLPKLRQQYARLPAEEQQHAILGIGYRIRSGEYADKHYVPALKRYIDEKLWTAALRAPPKQAPTKAQTNQEIADQVFSNLQLARLRREEERQRANGQAKH